MILRGSCRRYWIIIGCPRVAMESEKRKVKSEKLKVKSEKLKVKSEKLKVKSGVCFLSLCQAILGKHSFEIPNEVKFELSIFECRN